MFWRCRISVFIVSLIVGSDEFMVKSTGFTKRICTLKRIVHQTGNGTAHIKQTVFAKQLN